MLYSAASLTDPTASLVKQAKVGPEDLRGLGEDGLGEKAAAHPPSMEWLVASTGQADGIAVGSNICAPADRRDALGPSPRYPFIGERLRWPPARGRGLARGAIGRVGGEACVRRAVGAGFKRDQRRGGANVRQ
jgi:hypothetical protein